MVEHISYKSIRDQLVSLSVDIEDKVKVCALLRRNIENERQQLATVEESVKKEFESQLEAEMERHREHSSHKTSISQELVQRKKNLMNRCSELVSAVQDQERDLATEVRAVYREAETTIEEEKKAFRSGYEDRLQKFLASKNAEYKESAMKAMDPNITRLQMQHEQELAEAQREQQTAERELQESLVAQLQAQLEDERMAAEEELRLSIRALEDKSSAEIDDIKREHRKQVQRLCEDQERDLEKHRLKLHEKAQRANERSHAELKQAQEESQQRVMELQQQHVKHLESLQEEHENELNALRKQAREKTRALQSEMRRVLRDQKGASGSNEINDSDSDTDGRSSTRSKASSSSKANSSCISSFSPKRSSPNRKPSAGSLRLDSLLEYSELTAEGDDSSSLAMERLVEENDMDTEALAEQELEIAAVLRAGQEDRDKQLQAEIRALESETLRLERQWRAKAEAEEKQALAAVLKEEEYSSVKNRHKGDNTGVTDAAELVVTREKLLQQVQTLRSQAERTATEEADAEREIAVYREGIAAHRARIRDKQEQHSLHLREVQLEYGPRLRELRENIDTITAQIREDGQRNKQELAGLEKEHAAELARLDTQVKGEVGRREEEIAGLRDAVETENAKIARLEKLIKQYSDRSISSSKEGASAPQQICGGGNSSVRSTGKGAARTFRVNGDSGTVSGGASVCSNKSRTSSAAKSQRSSSYQRPQQQQSSTLQATTDQSLAQAAEACDVSNDSHNAPAHRDSGGTRTGGAPIEITVRSSRNSSRSSSNSQQNVSSDRASRSALSATERLHKQRHTGAEDNDPLADERSSRWHNTAPSGMLSSVPRHPSGEEDASSTESEPEEPQPVPSWIRRKQPS